MAKSKTKNRARKSGGQRKSGTKSSARPEHRPAASSGGGGVMQSMRSGFKRAAGVGEPNQKESTLSKVIWGILMLAAGGYLVYKYTQ